MWTVSTWDLDLPPLFWGWAGGVPAAFYRFRGGAYRAAWAKALSTEHREKLRAPKILTTADLGILISALSALFSPLCYHRAQPLLFLISPQTAKAQFQPSPRPCATRRTVRLIPILDPLEGKILDPRLLLCCYCCCWLVAKPTSSPGLPILTTYLPTCSVPAASFQLQFARA